MEIIDELIKSESGKDLRIFSKLTIIPDFMSHEECQIFINMINNNDLEKLATRKRHKFISEKLANWYWNRLKQYYQSTR